MCLRMDAVRARQSASTALLITRLLIFVTLGYWAFGKSFAYLGMYPIYIGEMLLGLGLLYLIHRGTIPVPNQLAAVVVEPIGQVVLFLRAPAACW